MGTRREKVNKRKRGEQNKMKEKKWEGVGKRRGREKKILLRVRVEWKLGCMDKSSMRKGRNRVEQEGEGKIRQQKEINEQLGKDGKQGEIKGRWEEKEKM